MKVKKSPEKKQDLIVPEGQRWDIGPYSLLKRMDDMFDELRKDFFDPFPMRRPFQAPLRAVEGQMVTPSMDIEEKDDLYNVSLELPGVPKDAIEINITSDMLEVKASFEECKEEKEKKYIHKERCYQGYQRRVGFAKEINSEKAKAELQDGILTVTLPKTVEDTKKVKKLKIK